MVTQNTNPFVFPGFGQSGDATHNPLLTSMEMMRTAWESLARAGGFEQTMMMPGTSLEDLERRIADLRVVEHWLRMNLSMLANTIQALEVQRATISTLKAFISSASSQDNERTASPSPLELVLGIRQPSTSDKAESTSGVQASVSGDSSGFFKAPQAGVGSSDESNEPSTEPSEPATSGPSAEIAMQGWWDMLQTQFDQLADATAATLKGAESMKEAATAAQQQAVQTMSENLAVAQQATQAAPPVKTAARKASAKKAVKKTATAKKAAIPTSKAASTLTATKTPKKAAKKTTSARASAATPSKTGSNK